MSKLEKTTKRINDIIDYECGTLSEEKTIDLFQSMIDDGSVWTLQGHYGRTAKALIDAGYCKPKQKVVETRHVNG